MKIELFRSVFGNIVLKTIIFKYSKLYQLYEINKTVAFQDRDSLNNYRYREFIEHIEYLGMEELQSGDLPSNGVLKQVSFIQERSNASLTKGEDIPFGVEILNYQPSYSIYESETPFSTLPTSLHTINNAVVETYYRSGMENNELQTIPPNIKSISIMFAPSLSAYRIPNTITDLDMGVDWDNKGDDINVGELPEGLVNLSMTALRKSNTLTSSVLPSTLKSLHISLYSVEFYSKPTVYERNYFSNLLSSPHLNVSTLMLKCCTDIKQEYNLYSCNSLTSLELDFPADNARIIEANSIPKSVTHLTISNYRYPITEDVIPTSVTNLYLGFEYQQSRKKDENVGIPNSVTSLTINRLLDNYPPLLTSFNLLNYDIFNIKQIDIPSLLPSSITTLCLPSTLRYHNISFPSNIKNLTFK